MSDDKRIFARRPVALQVRLAMDDVGTFVERYAINISEGGIFIRSREPRPVGSKLRFIVQLRTGEIVFEGEGTVRWSRLPDAQGLGVAGMGLQFDDLTEESRGILNEIIRARQEERVPQAVEGATPDSWRPINQFPTYEPTPAAVTPVRTPPVIGSPPEPPPRERTPTPVRPPPPSDGFVLGIDFGWGRIRAAVSSERQARPIQLSGDGGLPVVAALTTQGLIVGGPARKALMEGAPGVRGVTQLLGMRPESPAAISWCKRQLAEPVMGEDGSIAVTLGKRVFSVRQIVEALLREVKTIAEGGLDGPVSRAVFAVPSSWTAAQRYALRQAAYAVDLEVDQIIAAPLAAALACHGPSGNRRSLVVDFGEGKIESAFVEQEDHVFELLAVATDATLGGADFDLTLVESILTEFEAETGLLVPQETEIFERTRHAARAAKEALSDELDYEVTVERLVDAGLSKADIQQTITRARFLALVGPPLDQAVEIARAPLVERAFRAADLADVLLLGGQASFKPYIRRLADKLGREPQRSGAGADAVAVGAALSSEGSDKYGRFLLAGMVGSSLSYGVPGGGLKRLIDRQLPLPAERVATIEPKAGRTIHLFQGEEPLAFNNSYVGAIIVSGGSAPKVSIAIGLDANGEVSVRASDAATGAPVPISFEADSPLAQAQADLA